MPERALLARSTGEAGAAPDDAGAYRFLVGRLIDEDTLQRAAGEARRSGVATHEVLVARGWIEPGDYLEALSAHLAETNPLPAAIGSHPATRLIDAGEAAPAVIAARIAATRGQGLAPLLVSRDALDWAEPAEARHARVLHAAHGLRLERPEQSAGSPHASWQLFAAPIALGAAIGGLVVAPADTVAALAGLVTVPFLFVVGLRLQSLAIVLARRRPAPARPQKQGRRRPVARIPDADLPVYSVLIPLFAEADVLPELVTAMKALDYPPAKLDVLLVLESVDHATIAAAGRLELPANIRVVVVPEMAPRTKPKALNYSLPLVRGDYVVVYDAEDEPAPNQLRRALAAFRAGPDKLVCVQARLNIYNARANWLTRGIMAHPPLD